MIKNCKTCAHRSGDACNRTGLSWKLEIDWYYGGGSNHSCGSQLKLYEPIEPKEPLLKRIKKYFIGES